MKPNLHIFKKQRKFMVFDLQENSLGVPSLSCVSLPWLIEKILSVAGLNIPRKFVEMFVEIQEPNKTTNASEEYFIEHSGLFHQLNTTPTMVNFSYWAIENFLTARSYWVGLCFDLNKIFPIICTLFLFKKLDLTWNN